MKYDFSTSWTLLIYALIVISSVMFMREAENARNNRAKHFSLIMVYLCLTVPMIIRNGVGTDYTPYLELALRLKSSYGSIFNIVAAANDPHEVELSFTILTLLLGNIPMLIFAVYAMLTQLFFLLGIWNYRKTVSPTLSVFIYLGVFYFRSYNIFRQALAVALVFYAIRYVKERKLLPYIVFVLFATFFHRSAIFAMANYFIFVEEKWYKYFIRCFVVAAILMFFLFTETILNQIYTIPFFSQYKNWYHLSNNSVFTLGTILQLLIAGLYFLYRKNENIQVSSFEQRLFDGGMIFQLAFHFLSFKLNNITRIGLYFSLFYILSLASFDTIKPERDKLNRKADLYKLFPIVYSIYQIVTVVLTNRFNTTPYSIWLF